MKQNKPIIFLTGQSGMLGTKLSHALSEHFQIHGLQRNGASANNPSWAYRDLLKQLNVKAPNAVIHLAGAGIADKRWNNKYKQVIYDSRIYGTQWLVDEILLHDELPETFMCASAIGYYGHRPTEQLTESSAKGDNFVAQIAEQWELATKRLDPVDTRVVNLRFGMILSDTGGALKDMIMPFKLALGGRLGSGKQQYSWIGIDDAIRAMHFLLKKPELHGAFNLTTPNPVSNQEFTKTLAAALNRPAFMHMPEFMVRLVFGEVADELLLADAHVLPKKLLSAGFEFEHPELAKTLAAMLP